MITPELLHCAESSVSCWLATVSESGEPNVSPKEAFHIEKDGRILLANIASPQTVRNIRIHSKVCLSFVNVFIQKGFKVHGEASILESSDPGYDEAHGKLTRLFGDTFTIVSIISIQATRVSPIVAPSYKVRPESTERDRIRESIQSYRVEEFLERVRD